MRNLHFKKIKKDKQIRNELQRAHFMIVLLSVGLIMILGTSRLDSYVPNALLSDTMMVLLGIIALISLFVLIALTKKK